MIGHGFSEDAVVYPITIQLTARQLARLSEEAAENHGGSLSSAVVAGISALKTQRHNFDAVCKAQKVSANHDVTPQNEALHMAVAAVSQR